MQLSLVINTCNQPAALTQVLKAVQAQSLRPGEVLIADDGSGREIHDLLRSWQKMASFPLRHVWQEKKGFRRSRILNRTILKSTGDYLVFLDGDCLPSQDFIKDHVALAERGFWVQGRRAFVKEPYVAAFNPAFMTVLKFALLGRLSGLGKAFRFPFPLIRKDQRMTGILGCNLGIWRDDLLAVNGYDESFEGWGKEDSDLGARLYHLGRRRKFVHGRAVIFHLNHPPLPKNHLCGNEVRLLKTLESKAVRAFCGIEQAARESENHSSSSDFS